MLTVNVPLVVCALIASVGFAWWQQSLGAGLWMAWLLVGLSLVERYHRKP